MELTFGVDATGKVSTSSLEAFGVGGDALRGCVKRVLDATAFGKLPRASEARATITFFSE